MHEDKPMSLLIRNLNQSTSPEDIRNFFQKYGSIRDIYLPLDYFSKKPRGFGFIEFARAKDAQSAYDELGTHAVLDGHEVSITIAQQGRKSPESMRSRGKLMHDNYPKRWRGDQDTRNRYEKTGRYHDHMNTRSSYKDDRLDYRNHRYNMSYSPHYPRYYKHESRCSPVPTSKLHYGDYHRYSPYEYEHSRRSPHRYMRQSPMEPLHKHDDQHHYHNYSRSPCMSSRNRSRRSSSRPPPAYKREGCYPMTSTRSHPRASERNKEASISKSQGLYRKSPVTFS